MNYQNGKIYKITANINEDDGDIYIGSTTQSLSKRMAAHRNNYKRWKNAKTENKTSSILIFEKYTVENCRIELVELFPCETKEQLYAREGFYIKNKQCVNKIVPLRTVKEFYQDNREQIAETHKKYYQDNKEQKLEYQKQLYQTNKEQILEQKKQYQQNNKQNIAEYNKQYYLRKKAEKQQQENNPLV